MVCGDGGGGGGGDGQGSLRAGGGGRARQGKRQVAVAGHGARLVAVAGPVVLREGRWAASQGCGERELMLRLQVPAPPRHASAGLSPLAPGQASTRTARCTLACCPSSRPLAVAHLGGPHHHTRTPRTHVHPPPTSHTTQPRHTHAALPASPHTTRPQHTPTPHPPPLRSGLRTPRRRWRRPAARRWRCWRARAWRWCPSASQSWACCAPRNPAPSPAKCATTWRVRGGRPVRAGVGGAGAKGPGCSKPQPALGTGSAARWLLSTTARPPRLGMRPPPHLAPSLACSLSRSLCTLSSAHPWAPSRPLAPSPAAPQPP